MNYEFPIINSIDDVLPAIDGRDEFIVFERDVHNGIDYKVSFADTFPDVNDNNDALRRECRGLLFHKDGTIAARRFHKFFNINERPETQSNAIDLSRRHVVLDKLDGSMVSPLVIDGKIIWTTMMGETDVAKMVYSVAKSKYDKFVFDMMDAGCSPIFEFYNGKNRIVVTYDKPYLTLTAIRHNVTGEYIWYDNMVDIAEQYGIPVVKSYGTVNDMTDFIDGIRDETDIEGRIICFVDGHRVKIKCDWYVLLHKAKEAITFEKDVWDMVINNDIDDVIPVLDKDDADRLIAFSDDFHARLNALETELLENYNNLVSAYPDRKDFAKVAFSMPDEWSRTLYMNHYTRKRNIYETLRRMVKMGTRSSTYVDEVAEQLKLPRWNYHDV